MEQLFQYYKAVCELADINRWATRGEKHFFNKFLGSEVIPGSDGPTSEEQVEYYKKEKKSLEETFVEYYNLHIDNMSYGEWLNSELDKLKDK